MFTNIMAILWNQTVTGKWEFVPVDNIFWYADLALIGIILFIRIMGRFVLIDENNDSSSEAEG